MLHVTEGITLAKETLRKIWKNEYVKIALMLILIVAIVLGFWHGFQLAMNTEYPALAVASGSMCTLPSSCDGWSHPFEPTLHVGDLIIVQKIAPEEIKAASYPDGDIIVFHKALGSELIVHRAIAKQTEDNKTCFRTKGDGNTGSDPTPVPEDDVVGKVILRIPWVGHVSLFMRNSSGIFIIIILIVILVIVEFIIPAFSSEKAEASARAEAKQEQNEEETYET